MLFALLTFGSLWFWPAAIIPFLILIYLVENERAVGALLTIIVTVAVFLALGDKGILPWIAGHPLNIAIDAAGYVVIGIIWGFVKWFFQVLRARDRYESYRADWVKKNGEINDVEVDLPGRRNGSTEKSTTRKAFTQSVIMNGVGAPKASENKGKIIFWMSYWPASAIWTLLNDPITRLYRFIYHRLGALFEKISEAMFSKYKNDLDPTV